MRRTDAPVLHQILRDRQVARWLPARVRHESGSEFVRRALREQRGGGGVSFAVEQREPHAVVGQIRFVDWSREEAGAEVGYWLRRRDWGRGYGSEALGLICGFGFRALGLHRIVANVVVGNVRSAQALERVGFRFEGVSRHAARLARGWGDVWNYALLRENWRGRRAGRTDGRARRRGPPIESGPWLRRIPNHDGARTEA